MSNDFYCQFGEHWAKKESKIHTPRQSDYICVECEDERTLNWAKKEQWRRRKQDQLNRRKDDQPKN